MFQENSLNVIFKENEEGLFKQVEDANSEIRRINRELERVDEDVKKCTEELDQRRMTTMMVRKNESLFNALLELETVKQEKTNLANQLEELSSSRILDSKRALLLSLQKEQSSLQELEQDRKLKCEHLRKSLARLSEASSNNDEGAAAPKLY
ncbi:hypothetical protein DNTS_000109 [Danionella cerebrum]|uniref:Uncharacterized protein n=1 Tax=Danionella cerebrum TaxID=2873325 RepID=A0A553RBT2_9TELE|nr:hypothetical protein DNTS_000109 [Danionella translucida]